MFLYIFLYVFLYIPYIWILYKYILFPENIQHMCGPDLGHMDRISDGKCNNSTLVNS